jgi:aminoglycoside phosphotransferase (APT) family kinase protein
MAGGRIACGAMEGIDEDRVTAWLAGAIGAVPPVAFELIAGGRSNLTYRVTDAAGSSCVLRRPPVHHVLPTAHDMAREHRVVSALAPTPVPVARTLGFCADPEVTGAPFYLMELVEGHIVRDPETASKVLDPKARRRAGESIADVLADLHAVDVDAVGLGDLGQRGGYLGRQLERWHGQFDKSQIPGEERVSLVDDLYRRLTANIPEQAGATIVHGDYRLDNTMLGDDGSVRAVLDWEICTLGDPLADLGLLMVYWSEPGDDHTALGVAPTTVEGFPSRDEMKSRYAERSGREVGNLDFYVAFGYWKLACILQGVQSRYAAGAAGGDRSGVDRFGPQVRLLAASAAQAAERL